MVFNLILQWGRGSWAAETPPSQPLTLKPFRMAFASVADLGLACEVEEDERRIISHHLSKSSDHASVPGTPLHHRRTRGPVHKEARVHLSSIIPAEPARISRIPRQSFRRIRFCEASCFLERKRTAGRD